MIEKLKHQILSILVGTGLGTSAFAVESLPQNQGNNISLTPPVAEAANEPELGENEIEETKLEEFKAKLQSFETDIGIQKEILNSMKADIDNFAKTIHNYLEDYFNTLIAPLYKKIYRQSVIQTEISNETWLESSKRLAQYLDLDSGITFHNDPMLIEEEQKNEQTIKNIADKAYKNNTLTILPYYIAVVKQLKEAIQNNAPIIAQQVRNAPLSDLNTPEIRILAGLNPTEEAQLDALAKIQDNLKKYLLTRPGQVVHNA